jgi:hypothetical protein
MNDAVDFADRESGVKDRSERTMGPVLLDTTLIVNELRAVRPTWTYTEVGTGAVPGRGLSFSVVLHGTLLLLIIMISNSALLRPRRLVVTPLRAPESQDSVLYLPVLGGGSEGSGLAGGASGDTGKKAEGLRAKSKRGFAYPGPQPSVSNPPRATLGTQTILQPSIENLPLLRREVQLPNMVKPPMVADAQPKQQPLVVKSQRVTMQAVPEKLVEAPKITLPTATDHSAPTMLATETPLPQKPVEKVVVQRAPDVSEVHGGNQDQKGLLVLNAIPPPPQIGARVPRAEERSLFAIAPADTTIIADPAAGATGGTSSASATGSGNRNDVASGDALADVSAGGRAKIAGTGSGTGEGGRNGNGVGTGVNRTGDGSGTGRGTTAGPGSGSGNTMTLGSGAGAGSAPGTGGFRGITIQGSGGRPNDSANLHPTTNSRRQTSYNTRIESTASSGGGLPDLGIFENEKVYTVFLDMKASDEDPAPSWILQYAVLQPQTNASDLQNPPVKVAGTPTPPYATLKEVPGIRPDLLRRNSHTLIVALAVMNTAGKLEQISIKQTPDSELIAPLVSALRSWMFEPAQINGKPVALKVMLGIRLSAGK